MANFFSRLIRWRNLGLFQLLPLPKKAIELPLNYIPGEPSQCGLACAAMIIEIFTQKYIDVSQLTQQYQSHRRYYLDTVGWTHHGLVDLLSKYGIYGRVFRRQSHRFVIDQLYKRHLVIVSLEIPERENTSQHELYQAINPNLPFTKHLCVVYGYKDGKLLLHDPRDLGIYNIVALPIKQFVQIFSGNGVVVIDPIR